MKREIDIELAPLTSLGVGGSAREMITIETEREAIDLLFEMAVTKTRFVVLGGGSNVVIADAGISDRVVRIAVRMFEFSPRESGVEIEVGAGEVWDDVVAECVRRGLLGIECLSGIPGWVGATPIQNVGAYGQEVSDTILSVRAFDTALGRVVELPATACAFAYRNSLFKSGAPGRYVVLAVTFFLKCGEPSPVRYDELRRMLSGHAKAAPDLSEIRSAVLALRRSKSMVLDPNDPNARSAGSFFLNPQFDPGIYAAWVDRIVREGVVLSSAEIPYYRQTSGDDESNSGPIKVPAAWLIERAGFRKGFRRGTVGISQNHSLAVVTSPGASAREVIAFAKEIQSEVARLFGIELCVEPVPLGFTSDPFVATT